MKLSDLEILTVLKTLTKPQRQILVDSGYTIESIATSQVEPLTKLKGIGKKTAEKAIEEAVIFVNAQGLDEAEQLAVERYYQKTPPWKIVENWEEAGLSIQDIALSSIVALSVLKGIDEDLASRCISAAQTKLNKRGLYESRLVSPGGGASPKGASPAFPVEWLSGQVDPPPMGVRVKRAFDQAKKEYDLANG